MKVHNILVTGRLYSEMAKLLQEKGVNKNFRFVAENEVCRDDFFWADAYVGFRPAPRFEFGNIRWVHSLGAGVDSFLWNREWKEDVLLTKTVGSFGKQISEYCLSYMLRDLQCHDVYGWYQSQRQWKPIPPQPLQSQCVVIYGTGHIGQQLASYLGMFGVQPIGISRSGQMKPHFVKVFPTDQASEVLPKADWVIAALPLTNETYHLFDEQFFALLNNASFINVGRGATVDEMALWDALENRNVRLAVLDVFENEPLPPESPLWQHPNVIITPHISALTSAEEAVDCFLQTLQRIEADEPLCNKVDVQKGY
ncbi:D-2-hydroxyacid dehydrogenase [Parageobacillus toebii]|uniref:D-3-phosphoglycerate dehydrogenase n=1 Tax=Parageobacillus toebii TaxID=153151 RepID=A0A150MB93_9BACL|nr:D-2-hydroxyacid dehydrogenase [Parageobacillus toebii]KYD21585.1 D-3-phosphoglycerate dehydrogenase [Parageobacillus toebii]